MKKVTIKDPNKPDGRKTLPQLYKKGQSGNPLGAKHPNWQSRNQWFNTIVGERKETLANLIIEKALAGSFNFAELAMSRLVPPAPPEEFNGIDGLLEATTWQEKIDCVIKALSKGDITPAQSQFMMTTLTAGKKILDDDAIQKLESRLDNLEKTNNAVT